MYAPTGTPATDPNFVNALSFFQQWVNANASTLPASLSAMIPLAYTNGTLDTYTLAILQQLA